MNTLEFIKENKFAVILRHIEPEDIADVVLYLLNLPRHVNINELEMMPVCQTYGGLSVTRSLDLNKKD